MSEQERNLDNVTTSMTVLALNNLVVSTRPVLQQVKVHVTGKLSKQIRLYKKRHGSEEQKAVFMKKAGRMAEEIATLKKANTDQLAKYCFANTLTFDEAAKTNSAETRVFTRVATHKLMSGKVKAWRAEHDDWKALAAFMLAKNTGRRFKKKKPKQNTTEEEDEDDDDKEEEEASKLPVTMQRKPEEKEKETHKLQNISSVKNLQFAKRALKEEEESDDQSEDQTLSADVRTSKEEEDDMEEGESKNVSNDHGPESESGDQSDNSDSVHLDSDASEDKSEKMDSPKQIRTEIELKEDTHLGKELESESTSDQVNTKGAPDSQLDTSQKQDGKQDGSKRKTLKQKIQLAKEKRLEAAKQKRLEIESNVISQSSESCVMELNLSSFAGKALGPIEKAFGTAESEVIEGKKKKKDRFFARDSGDETSEEEEEEEEEKEQEDEEEEDQKYSRFGSNQEGSRYKSGKFEKWDKKGGKKFDGPRGKKFDGPRGKKFNGPGGKKFDGPGGKFGDGGNRHGGLGGKKYGGLGGGSKPQETVAPAPAQTEKLHPSWEASRKRKLQQNIAPTFTGKKITFDD